MGCGGSKYVHNGPNVKGDVTPILDGVAYKVKRVEGEGTVGSGMGKEVWYVYNDHANDDVMVEFSFDPMSEVQVFGKGKDKGKDSQGWCIIQVIVPPGVTLGAAMGSFNRSNETAVVFDPLKQGAPQSHQFQQTRIDSRHAV